MLEEDDRETARTPEEAMNLLLDHVSPVGETRELPLSEAAGFILAEDQ